MSNFSKSEKENLEAYILAMRAPARATEEERKNFELLRQVALGRSLTDEEKAAIDAANLYKTVNESGPSRR